MSAAATPYYNEINLIPGLCGLLSTLAKIAVRVIAMISLLCDPAVRESSSGNENEVSSGVVKQPKTREVVKLCRKGGRFEVTELNALSVAFRVFNVKAGAGDGELFP